jgi:hypothetical protein
VNAALDRHPIELDRDQFLRRTLALELIELLRSMLERISSRSILVPTPAVAVQRALAGFDRLELPLLYPEQFISPTWIASSIPRVAPRPSVGCLTTAIST